jgi:hypothetical protein
MQSEELATTDVIEPGEPATETDAPDGDAEDLVEPTGGETVEATTEASTDQRLELALKAVERQTKAFRSALVLTMDQVRSRLDAQSARDEGPGKRAAVELGSFATGRIDPDRFAMLTSFSKPDDMAWLAPSERALETLRAVHARGDELFRVRVESGGDLYAAVERALSEAGRAFGAARLVELARAGRYIASEHDPMLDRLAFREWSAAERAKAPPLVIEVEGRDLAAGALAGFLDGAVKIVLVVLGASSPAPLVRLVTPGILVMQTIEPEELRLVGAADGPAIAALVSPEVGQFLHEPAAGGVQRSVGVARVEVRHVPDEEPKRTLGQISAFQQAEELRSLRALAASAATAGGAGAETGAAGESTARGVSAESASQPPETAGEPPAEPVDKLAAWLLKQADLSDLEPGA